MTILQYLSAFRLFGGDVLVLGLAVTIAVSVLKKTALKKVTKKMFVFLPFVLGAIVFAAYRCLAELSIAPLTSGLAATLDSGFACGCVATLYYVVYEQFLRVKTSAVSEGSAAAGAASAETGDAVSAADGAANAAEDGSATGATAVGETTLSALLQAFVPDGALSDAVNALVGGRAGMNAEAFRSFVSETLARYAPALGEEERAAVSEMVASVMKTQA